MAEMTQERPGAILARFPGPVHLAINRRKWAWMVAICATFIVIGCWMILSSPAHPALGWPTTVFFGLGAIVGILMFLPNAGGLVLDDKRFEVRSLFRSVRMSWGEASDFAIVTIPVTDQRMLGFNLAGRDNHSLGKLNATLVGRNGALPGNYVVDDADLARLLNEWRERALATSA